MGRIDPQFGPDFRPGYRPDYSPGYSLFAVLPQEEHRDDHPSGFDDLEQGRKTARGIINAACIAMVFWAIVAAIVLLAWGI
jgi:hypothetical protein